jgi:hypothetical protein
MHAHHDSSQSQRLELTQNQPPECAAHRKQANNPQSLIIHHEAQSKRNQPRQTTLHLSKQFEKQKTKPDQTKTHYTQHRQEQEPERRNFNIIINARPGSLAFHMLHATHNTQTPDFMQAQRKSSTTAWFELKAKVNL